MLGTGPWDYAWCVLGRGGQSPRISKCMGLRPREKACWEKSLASKVPGVASLEKGGLRLSQACASPGGDLAQCMAMLPPSKVQSYG